MQIQQKVTFGSAWTSVGARGSLSTAQTPRVTMVPHRASPFSSLDSAAFTSCFLGGGTSIGNAPSQRQVAAKEVSFQGRLWREPGSSHRIDTKFSRTLWHNPCCFTSLAFRQSGLSARKWLGNQTSVSKWTEGKGPRKGPCRCFLAQREGESSAA